MKIMMFFLKPCLLIFAVCMVNTVVMAQTYESHRQGEIDTTEPIYALDQLDSLKNPSNLTVNLPTIHHFSTQNQIPVLFVKTDNLPILDISVRFNAGSARDVSIQPKGYGIASLTANLLTKGTKQKTENQIAEISEQLGINLSSQAYKDMFVVSLRSLSDQNYLTPAINLLQEILTDSVFLDENLERTKAQYLVNIKKQAENPDQVAYDVFMRELYGDHPYAHPTMGTLESIPTIQCQDLQNFAKQYLVAKNANIAITGNISLQEAKKIADQLTHTLPTGKPAPTLPEAKPLTQGKVIHIPFHSSQTAIVMGQIGTKRHQDLQQDGYFEIANEIIGGGHFQARLMSNIRKKRGLTYGIYARMMPMQSQGFYSIQFSTRNEKADEAVQETLNVLNDAVQNGLTQTEVDLTKENLINSFPLSVSSNASINNILGMMGFYQLSDDYLTGYVQRIQQSSLQNVQQQYQKLIQPNHFLIVTVGQKDVAQSQNDLIKK